MEKPFWHPKVDQGFARHDPQKPSTQPMPAHQPQQMQPQPQQAMPPQPTGGMSNFQGKHFPPFKKKG